MMSMLSVHVNLTPFSSHSTNTCLFCLEFDKQQDKCEMVSYGFGLHTTIISAAVNFPYMMVFI